MLVDANVFVGAIGIAFTVGLLIGFIWGIVRAEEEHRIEEIKREIRENQKRCAKLRN
jgi:hypothetical protein